MRHFVPFVTLLGGTLAALTVLLLGLWRMQSTLEGAVIVWAVCLASVFIGLPSLPSVWCYCHRRYRDAARVRMLRDYSRSLAARE